MMKKKKKKKNEVKNEKSFKYKKPCLNQIQ
jgi:hypothetical protein